MCSCDSGIEGQSREVKKVEQFHDTNGALVREIPYNKAGKIHGILREWNSFGDVMLEISYKDGKKDGHFKENVGYGSIKEGRYKDNHFIGSIKTHNEREGLIEEEIYSDEGAPLEYTSWYDSGQKKSERAFYNDWSTKYHVEYYENGEFKYLYNNFQEKTWYENGQQKSEKNNNGTWRNWYENGQLESECDSNKISRYWYENGQLKSEKNHDGISCD